MRSEEPRGEVWPFAGKCRREMPITLQLGDDSWPPLRSATQKEPEGASEWNDRAPKRPVKRHEADRGLDFFWKRLEPFSGDNTPMWRRFTDKFTLSYSRLLGKSPRIERCPFQRDPMTQRDRPSTRLLLEDAGTSPYYRHLMKGNSEKSAETNGRPPRRPSKSREAYRQLAFFRKRLVTFSGAVFSVIAGHWCSGLRKRCFHRHSRRPYPANRRRPRLPRPG